MRRAQRGTVAGWLADPLPMGIGEASLLSSKDVRGEVRDDGIRFSSNGWELINLCYDVARHARPRRVGPGPRRTLGVQSATPREV